MEHVYREEYDVMSDIFGMHLLSQTVLERE